MRRRMVEYLQSCDPAVLRISAAVTAGCIEAIRCRFRLRALCGARFWLWSWPLAAARLQRDPHWLQPGRHHPRRGWPTTISISTRAQKQEFHARIDRLHDWHRHEQLPEYVAFLNASEDSACKRGLRREDVLWFIDGAQSALPYSSRAAPLRDAADMLATLAPRTARRPAEAAGQGQPQVRPRIQARRRHPKTSGGARAQTQARRRSRDWTGGLTRAQEQQITAHARRRAAHRLSCAMRTGSGRQREFLQLLELRGDKRRIRREAARTGCSTGNRAARREYDRLLVQVSEQRIA